MRLKCKKNYYTEQPRIFGKKKIPRISKGKYYEVMRQYTKPCGERYWLFKISCKINPNGSGHFDIDEYFETPEEVRENKIKELLENIK